MSILYKTRKGMTLTELLVAMSILVIVSTGLSVFFADIWKSKSNEVEMGSSLLKVSQSINKMTTIIRQANQADSGAYLIDSADDFDFIIYANIDDDDDIERVHYYLDGSDLKMGIADPILGTNPSYPESDGSVKVLATDVVNESDEPIFVYYDNNYAALTTPASIPPIRLVRINIRVNTDPNKISDVVISSLTSFRNLDN